MADSPHIERISWGVTEVGGLGRHKDVKLWPGGGREWDWRETGTRHDPGVQPADVDELLGHGVEVVVIGIGMQRALGVCPETLDELGDRGVEVHVDQTEAAANRYNRLAEAGRPVGALIHSTC